MGNASALAKGVEYFQYARRNDRPYGIFDTITRISATETEQAVTAAAVVMLADESAVTLSLEKATTNSDSPVLCPEVVSELA